MRSGNSSTEFFDHISEAVLSQPHPPAGALLRIGLVRDKNETVFATGSVVFMRDEVPGQGALIYPRVMIIDEWVKSAATALEHLRSFLVDRRLRLGGTEISAELQGWRWDPYFHSTRELTSGWPERSGYIDIAPSKTTSRHEPWSRPVVAPGLPAYRNAAQLMSSRVFGTRYGNSLQTVWQMLQLHVAVPELRGRIKTAQQQGTQFRIIVEAVDPMDQFEVHVLASGHSSEGAFTTPDPSGKVELTVPAADPQEAGSDGHIVYLLHKELGLLQEASPERAEPAPSRSPTLDDIARHELSRGENDHVEYKPFIEYKSLKKEAEVLRTVAAFLNTRGGRLYLGVHDNPVQLLGTEELRKSFKDAKSEEEALEIQKNRFRTLIAAEVQPNPKHCEMHVVRVGEAPVIVIEIGEGPNPPYAHVQTNQSSKILVRRGDKNYEATPEEIKALTNKKKTSEVTGALFPWNWGGGNSYW